jgi:hypothetical protein
MAVAKSPRRHRKIWGVGLSIALHALIGVYLGRAPRSRNSPAPGAIVRDVIQIDVRTPAGFAAPSASGSSVAPPRVRRIRSAGPVAARPADDLPRATLQLRAGPDRLAFDGVILARFERDGVIAPTPVAAARPERGPSFSQRLAVQMREANARMNVVEGHAQPFLYDFVRAARRDFKPAEGRLYADPRSPNTVKRALRAWGHQHFRADPRYLAWQKLVAERKAAAHGGTLDEADVLRRYGQMVDDNAAANEPITAMICATLRPDLPPRIEVSTSSGNSELDRAAITALTRATSSRPPDPALKPQRACYHFTAAVERAPPIVISGCSFDEVKLTLGCYYPAMKVLRTNVTLASVD